MGRGPKEYAPSGGVGEGPYLGQRVLAAALEAVALAVEGDKVAVPVGHAGTQAGLAGALPPAASARAVRRGEAMPRSAGREGNPPTGQLQLNPVMPMTRTGTQLLFYKVGS